MNIIAFSPHADDVEIAMGGTIARYSQAGHKVLIVVVTIPQNKKIRSAEALKASKILGTDLLLLNIPSNSMIYSRKLVGIFDGIVKNFPPDIMYTSWVYDTHQDHAVVAHASLSTARRNTCSLYMFPSPYPSGVTTHAFHEQSFVDITETMDKKIESVLAHKTQVAHFGKEWVGGIKARAAYMGAFIGVEFAEVFDVIKEIQKI